MFACWRPRLVEEALLRQEHEGLLRYHTTPDAPLARRDLFWRSTDMNGARSQTFSRAPGNWPIKGKIYLEDAWPVAESSQLTTVTVWQSSACECEQLARRHVAENSARLGQFGKGANLCVGHNLTAEIAQIGREGVNDTL
jgi:hypothetical protein